MATVQVLTAAKTQELTGQAFVSGIIDETGDLILTTLDGTEINLGNVQTDNVRPMTAAVIAFTDPNNVNAYVEVVTITGDGTDPEGWPDRLAFFYNPNTGGETTPRLTSFFNEYGEFRVCPAKLTTTAWRAFVKDSPTNPSGTRSATVPVIEMMDDRTNRNNLWGVLGSGQQVTKGIPVNYTIVLGPADSVPAGTPTGTVIVRTS